MKALVTGGTGFVGGHLIDQLLARGDSVTALVRSLPRAAHLAERGVRLVAGDLDAHEALAEAVAGQDQIYHVAALTGAVNEAEFLHANRDGTANLVTAAESSGTDPRLVLVSSMAAGGPSSRGRPRSGAGHDAPVTMYGRSKLAGEAPVRASRLRWTILRPPTVYGPRDRDNLLVIFKAARLGWVPVFGDGSMELSLVQVEDLASAIILAGNNEALLQQTWYVNHPEVITSGAIARIVAKAVGRQRIRLIPLPQWVTAPILALTGSTAELLGRKTILRGDKIFEFYQEAWTGDATPFIAASGWAPRFDFLTGATATAAWYRQEKWL